MVEVVVLLEMLDLDHKHPTLALARMVVLVVVLQEMFIQQQEKEIK